MLLLALLFAAVLVLLVYSFVSDTGKNTKHFRKMDRTSRTGMAIKKKPLKMGDSLY